ncbi:tyrosine-type recombinase/integrase [Thalassotalea crassostreae]|uniref:tyrosine-type recombinase/integrase n=1 Tax=Thalassotalea crassostreae TaxID=1763536 RepID=UPI0008381804|nr:tyrosine-type recombinase/integrase [Thalassotalea crassostreae]
MFYSKQPNIKQVSTQIANIYETHCDIKVNAGKIKDLLSQTPELYSDRERYFSQKYISRINSYANSFSGNEKMQYGIARDAILFVHVYHFDWSLPPIEQQKVEDKYNKAFERVSSFNKVTEKLHAAHQRHLTSLLDNGAEIPIGAIALTFLLETMPLSLAHLAQVLSSKKAIDDHSVTELNHFSAPTAEFVIDKDSISTQYSRIALRPTTYLLLSTYHDFTPISEDKLRTELLAYVKQLLPSAKISKTNLPLILKCHWQWQTNTWAAADLYYPENQWAIPPERYHQLVNSNHLRPKQDYLNGLDLFRTFKAEQSKTKPDKASAETEAKSSSTKTRVPPTVELLKRYDGKNREAALLFHEQQNIEYDEDNIVPALHYYCVKDFIEFGGSNPTKPIEKSSIENYTAIKGLLKSHPLALYKCFDESELERWALNLYNDAKNTSQRKTVLKFLQRIRYQSIIENLDLSELLPVWTKPKTDANTITPSEVLIIDRAIEAQSHDDPLSIEFTRLALALAFHGALRRGEVRRLRIQDCERLSPTGDVYRLKITNTKEGKTKRRKTRYVYLALPEKDSERLNMILELKKHAPIDEPLIGYGQETQSQREQRYFKPISLAIKAICGQSARFHHLRHGGAWVLTMQGIRLFTPATPLPAILKRDAWLFTKAYCEKRFWYWCENRNIEHLNCGVLFDEIKNMLGHSSFATTRLSYLHGHEWVCDAFASPYITISKTHFRQLLQLPKKDRRLARAIERLSLLAPKKEFSNETQHNTLKLLYTQESLPTELASQYPLEKNDLLIYRSALLPLMINSKSFCEEFVEIKPSENKQVGGLTALNADPFDAAKKPSGSKTLVNQGKALSPTKQSNSDLKLDEMSVEESFKKRVSSNGSFWSQLLNVQFNNASQIQNNNHWAMLSNLRKNYPSLATGCPALSVVNRNLLNRWQNKYQAKKPFVFVLPTNDRVFVQLCRLLNEPLFKYLKTTISIAPVKTSDDEVLILPMELFLSQAKKITTASKFRHIYNLSSDRNSQKPLKATLQFNAPKYFLNLVLEKTHAN